MARAIIEWDMLNYAVIDSERKAAASSHKSRTAKGPDLSVFACACGKFGPWGDGLKDQARFYCEEHVPPQVRYAGQFFKEMYE